MHKIILTLISGFFLLLLGNHSSMAATLRQSSGTTRQVLPNLPSAITVLQVEDGDTELVKFTQTGAIGVIRAACLDTPEIPHSARESALKDPVAIAQFKWGNAAKTTVNQLFKSAKTIQATIVDYDLRYNRNVAQISLDGDDLGLKLISGGYALTFPQYLDRCANAAAMNDAEKSARDQKLGRHSESVMVPAEFRKVVSKMQ